MRAIQYQRAGDEGAALAAMRAAPREGEGERTFLAGGTTLLDLMKLDVMAPEVLVDINALPMAKVEAVDGGLRLGALARNSDVAYDPLVRERIPLLSEALLSGASPQLRNMATVGGNLLQRTRCPYFRDTGVEACNKRRPGSGCAALEGFHRGHAVLGVSEHCIATHPSDMCIALAALDARVIVKGEAGERTIAFADFHLAPEDHPERETTLAPGELITAVQVPTPPRGAKSVYVKVRDRTEYAFALVSVGALAAVEGGVIKDVRLALGGVATKPWRATKAETMLVGARPSAGLFRQAAAQAFEGARARTHNAFKIELGKRTIERALATVAGLA